MVCMDVWQMWKFSGPSDPDRQSKNICFEWSAGIQLQDTAAFSCDVLVAGWTELRMPFSYLFFSWYASSSITHLLERRYGLMVKPLACFDPVGYEQFPVLPQISYVTLAKPHRLAYLKMLMYLCERYLSGIVRRWSYRCLSLFCYPSIHPFSTPVS